MKIDDLLAARLKAKGIDAFVFDEVTSTFDKAREIMPKVHNGVVITHRQTMGRGKGERKFSSPDGGVYFSVFHKNAPVKASDALKTVLNAGFGVFDALKGLGFEPKLKWPNDVLIDGKKVCGILTELTTAGDEISLSCGVGVNVNTKDLGELDGIATSLFLQSGKLWSWNDVAERLVLGVESRLFDEKEPKDEFFTKSGMMNKTVKVSGNGVERFLTVTGMTSDGFLMGLDGDREIKIVNSDVKEVTL